jgi:hypothetical protein
MVNAAKPAIPATCMDRINQADHRALDDSVEEAFNQACQINDLAAAHALLEVLEQLHARRQIRQGPESRIDDAVVCRARQELQLRSRSPDSPRHFRAA